MVDDLLVRVDAQVSQFNAGFGSATKSTLQLEAALKRASAQQALYEKQLAQYGATNARTQTALARAQMSNARLAEQQAAIQAKAAAAQAAAVAKHQAALSRLGTTAGKVGLVAGLAFGLAAKGAADFDQAMSRVEATGDDARQNLDALRQAALDFGQSTQFSATEAADGITELVKAGVSARDVLGGGLKGALDLAAAGELDVATAANIAATAMTQFNLAGTDVPHVADLLAAAAGKAQGEVTDMAEALKYVGPIANQMGVSIDETVGTVAELATQGVLASQAGTSLRGILSSLTSPSAAAAAEMKRLGINVYDARGNFVGFSGVAGQLRAHMSDLTNAERDQALGRIFGNQQITAARILYAGGAKDVDKWTDAVNDEGFAADTAATKMDNLRGDLEKLSGALQTALIGAGDASQGPLRETVQVLTEVVDAYADLPAPIQSFISLSTLFIAALGLATFAVIKLSAGATALRANLATVSGSFATARVSAASYVEGLLFVASAQQRATLTAAELTAVQRGAWVSLGKTAGVLGLLAITATGVADNFDSTNAATGALVGSMKGPLGAALGALIGGAIDAAHANDELEEAMRRVNEVAGGDAALDLKARADAAAALAASTQQILDDYQSINAKDFTPGHIISNAGELLGFTDNLDDARAAASKFNTETLALQQGIFQLNMELGNAPADTLGTDLEHIQAAAERVIPALTGAGYSVEQIQNILLTHVGWDEAIAAAERYVHSQDTIPGRTRGVVAAVSGLGDEMLTAAQSAEELSTALDALLSPQMDLEAATDAYTTSLRHLSDDLAKNNKTLVGNSDAAITNREAIRGRVEDLTAQLEAEAKAGATSRELSKSLETQRDRLLNAADAAHLNTDEVRALLVQYGLTPKLIKTLIEANTDTASQRVRDFRDLLAQIKSKQITIEATFTRHGQIDPGIRGATGGTVRGGIPGRDSVAVLLEPGEEVVNARQSAIHRPLIKSINAGTIARFAEGGTAGGRFTVADLRVLLARPEDVTTLADVNRLMRERRHEEGDLARALEHLRDVRRDSTSTDRELAAAEERVTDARDDARRSTDDYRTALDDLKATAQGYVSQVQELGSAFGGEATATTAQGLLAKKQSVASDAEEFRTYLGILKRKGADKDWLDEIRSRGPTQEAVALAADLASQSRRFIHRVDIADNAVDRAGRSLGTFGVGGAHIGTQIARQANVYIDRPQWGPTRRDLERGIRRAAENALRIMAAP